MTSVLFWNVSTFGINKINDPDTRVRPRQGGSNIGGNSPQAASWMRRTLMDNILAAANPDIVVIVEVGSGDSYPSDLATFTGGIEGAIYLLNRLRAATPGAGWRLVPPLRVGRSPGSKPETVAVLYKGITAAGQRYFTGPNRWSGGANGFSRPGPALGHAYGAGPPNLDAMLVPPVVPAVPARVIPATAQYNGGLAENVVAARVLFKYVGAPLYNVDYGVFRPPYMATFSEANAMGVVTRNITIFGVHSPAVAGDPNVYITYLTQTADVVNGLGANETRLIGGDFNLNLMTPAGAYSNVYAPLANYTPLLQTPGAPAPANLSAFQGYFATHIKPDPDPDEDTLFLWSDAATQSPYPGYGYIGSYMVANFYSIDNILVWPHQGPPYNYQTSIINPISGSPFNQVLPTPGGAPQGTVVLGQQMLNCLQAWPQVPTAPRLNLGRRKNMISWDNYRYQWSTSDHLAVYAVV